MPETKQLNLAFVMLLSRFGSMFIGLASVPILLATLGEDQFSAWALLMGISLLLHSLEMGMAPTVIKLVTHGMAIQDETETTTVISNAIGYLAIIYAVGFVCFIPLVDRLAVWLKLPGSALMSGSELLLLIFVSIGVTTLVKTPAYSLCSVWRHEVFALFAFLQTCCAHVLAWIIAWMTQRLDFVVIGYWVAYLAVWITGCLVSKKIVHWHFVRSSIQWLRIKAMLGHGYHIQIRQLTFNANFQFDKMIISGMGALAEVARYEIACAPGQALLSLADNAFSTYLPAVTNHYSTKQDIWPDYLRITRMTLHFAVVLFGASIIAASFFLFAWAGQIGYHGRWVFYILLPALFSAVLIMPISYFFQAMGRTCYESLLGVTALVINIASSVVLIQWWGKEGAALGTSLAIILNSCGYVWLFHRYYNKAAMTTVRFMCNEVSPVLPLLLFWFIVQSLLQLFVMTSRFYMGPTAVLLFIGTAWSLLKKLHKSGRLLDEEVRFFKRFRLL